MTHTDLFPVLGVFLTTLVEWHFKVFKEPYKIVKAFNLKGVSVEMTSCRVIALVLTLRGNNPF